MEKTIIRRLEQLLEQKERVLVAIDGNCTAGKTTLAARLAECFDCNVFHMDDFFLRPEQRTAQRYAETGGNVDYERFRQEVLLPLKEGKAFSYRPFDCKTLTLRPPVAVVPKKCNIIEGSYSMHPYFGECYDLKIFLGIDPQLQELRVLERPAAVQQRFFDTWIPMENRYIGAFAIREGCDLAFLAKRDCTEAESVVG